MASTSNVEIASLAEDLDLTVDPAYVESKRRDFSTQYAVEPSEEVDYMINIFGGSNRSGRWTVAKEIRSVSIIGGANLDFTDAQFSKPEVSMRVFCLFGGDNIYVPENVNVVSKAFCIFGGINIKLKRTIKEKFVAFADNMKNMFN